MGEAGRLRLPADCTTPPAASITAATAWLDPAVEEYPLANLLRAGAATAPCAPPAPGKGMALMSRPGIAVSPLPDEICSLSIS